MWIDFNGTIFKLEDIKYIDKFNISQCGKLYYALKIETAYITITKTYGSIARNSKGYMEREEDYETLYKQLKEN